MALSDNDAVNVTTLQTEQTWQPLRREPLISTFSAIQPFSVSGFVLRTCIRRGSKNVLGRLQILEAPFALPQGKFKVTCSVLGNQPTLTFENKPAASWPNFVIELLVDLTLNELTPGRFYVYPADFSVKAELLYTRVVYFIYQSLRCVLHVKNVFDGPREHELEMSFNFQPWTKEQQQKIIYRAKIARKLSFIERVFKVRYSLPGDITAEEVQRIETVFRGITEGEFNTRTKGITLMVHPSEIDLSRPPFSGPGPFIHQLKNYELLLGPQRPLQVGPVSIRMDRAVVANARVLEHLFSQREPVSVRFEVLDNQVSYRFENFASKDAVKRSRRLLDKFRMELSWQDSAELASATDQSLISNVSSTEAIEIAVGWLQYHDLPDRLCPQAPELDQSLGCWHVPIFIVYPAGQGEAVGELLIDSKTGKITAEPSPEELQNAALIAGERLLHAT